MRIGGFSLGGEPIFDEPLALDEMIASLSESHEVSADHGLSAEGRAQLRALAETLASAWTDVRARLNDDTDKKTASNGEVVVSLAHQLKARHGASGTSEGQ